MQLPETIGILSNISYVNLSKNQLSNLPEEFYDLPYIYTLNLS